MHDRPNIKIAIPKRRYQVGDFGASLLGEIESGDARRFRYILAFVQLGQAQPSLYVCAEPADAAGPGKHALRVINEVMSEVVDTDERWGDLDAFAEQGLKLGMQFLGLQREQVAQLM
jgi:hypothetical protein